MAALTTTPVTPVTPVAPVTPNAPVPVGTTAEILLTACERCGHMAEYRQGAACLLCSLQIARLATGKKRTLAQGRCPAVPADNRRRWDIYDLFPGSWEWARPSSQSS